MVLSSDEMEILEFLRCRNGEFVAVAEICRRAGGRKKFLESPNWAKTMMNRLVEGSLIEVNERGHYRFKGENGASTQQKRREDYRHPSSGVVEQNYFLQPQEAEVVDDNYFPGTEPISQVIDEDYFPGPEEPVPDVKPASSVKEPVLPIPHIIDEDYFPESED